MKPACVVCLLAQLLAVFANLDGSSNLLPIYLREPKDVYVGNAKRATLSCQVGVQAVASRQQTRVKEPQRVAIVWLLNGTALVGNRLRDFTVSNKGDESLLTISNFRQQLHQGRYQCLSNLTFGSVLSRPAFVRQAFIAPTLEQSAVENVTITMTVGNTAFISCLSPFNISVPRAEVLGFEINGSPLALTQRHFVTNDGNLMIASVQQADQGNYRCKFSNSALNLVRLSRNSNFLRVIDPKKDKDGPAPRHLALRTPQSSISAVVGQNVSIECVFIGLPPPRTVWEFAMPGESQHQVTPSADGRITVHSGALQITNVQVEDAGEYSCSSIDSRSVPHYARLTVSKPPYFESEAASYQITAVRVGGRLELDCNVLEANRWSWFLNGSPLPGNGQQPSKLVINGASALNSGVYQCFGENQNGVAVKTVKVTVGSSLRSTFQIQEPPSNNSVSLDELAVFACIADGNTKDGTPSWTWLKDGQALPNDSRILVEAQNELTSSLQIFNVKLSDAGAYTCVLPDAGNSRTTRATAWLTVESPTSNTGVNVIETERPTEVTRTTRRTRTPRRRMTTAASRTSAWPVDTAHTEIYIVVVNSSSVVVSWSHSEAVLRWLYGTAVLYKVANSSDSNERKFVTAEVNRYVLTQLLPDTVYEVWVVAQQQNGDKAKPSDTVLVRTPSVQQSLDLEIYNPWEEDDEDRQTMDASSTDKLINEILSESHPLPAQQSTTELSEVTGASSASNAVLSDSLDLSTDTSSASQSNTTWFALLAAAACGAALLIGVIVAVMLSRARRYSNAKQKADKSPSSHSRISEDNSILSYTKLPQSGMPANLSPAEASGFHSVNIGLLCDTVEREPLADQHLVLTSAGYLNGPLPLCLPCDSHLATRYESATCGPSKRASLVLHGTAGSAIHLVNNPQIPMDMNSAAYHTLLASQPCNIASFLSNIRPPSAMNAALSSAQLHAINSMHKHAGSQLTGSSSSLSNGECSECDCGAPDVNCNRECHHGLPKSPRLDAHGHVTCSQMASAQGSATLQRKRKHAKYRSARRKSANQKEANMANVLTLNLAGNGALTNLN